MLGTIGSSSVADGVDSDTSFAVDEVTTIGIVPTWAIGAEVEYPDGRIDQVDVTDETVTFDAKFFVTRASFDEGIEVFDRTGGESLVEVRAVYDSEAQVAPVNIDLDSLRPLTGLGDLGKR